MYSIYNRSSVCSHVAQYCIDRGQAGVSNKYTFRLSCDKAKIPYLKSTQQTDYTTVDTHVSYICTFTLVYFHILYPINSRYI